MINLQIDIKTFLSEYWQKKPLLIRQALPKVTTPLSGDELAGLSLEDDVESRLVFETPGVAPFWQLKTGPFVEDDFKTLPKTHWTLLVQGVDRLIPEVASLLDAFDFIPQWRVDDVMISYAAEQGSVGPHYDNYDVFLYQAVGRRKWLLTTQHCHPSNYLSDVPLRIMDQFIVEQEYILEPGDMLYLPPHVGHHGISLSNACMTYSFGYRSYQVEEMWSSVGDYLSEHLSSPMLYQDPNWANNDASVSIPSTAWLNAKQLMQQVLEQDHMMKTWFGCFVTCLDAAAEQQLPMPLDDDERGDLSSFMDGLMVSKGLLRDACCRFAYHQEGELQLFINGSEWNTDGMIPELVHYVANHRELTLSNLRPYLDREEHQLFLYELWILQWLSMV